MSLENGRSHARLAHLVQHALECCLRGIDLTLRQSQLGEARIWRLTPVARLSIGTLGVLELTPQSMQLRLAIQRAALTKGEGIDLQLVQSVRTDASQLRAKVAVVELAVGLGRLALLLRHPIVGSTGSTRGEAGVPKTSSRAAWRACRSSFSSLVGSVALVRSSTSPSLFR